MLGWVLAFVALAAAASAEDTGRLVPLQVDPDVVYGHKMGMALTFDVLKPTTANGAGVLFMVSGGWISNWSPPAATAKRFEGLLDHGFTVFAVRHVLCASDVEGYPMAEVLALADDETRESWERLQLGYTESTGHPLLRREIAALY